MRTALTNHETTDLPFSDRRTEDVPGHWLLASLGKKVLRPGGRVLTESMLAGLPVAGADVVELAPGLGLTSRLLLDLEPASYVGVEQNADAAAIASDVVAGVGRVVVGDAMETGLESDSADVVVNEAMLTMQTDRAKAQIVAEVFRVLRPGGRYAFHELALTPDDIDPAIATDVRVSLARSIKVNARPLTVAEWTALLTDAGFRVQTVTTAEMALLKIRRVLADEGLRGTLTIGRNYLRMPDARRRVNTMARTFHRHRRSIVAVAMVAHKPTAD